MFIKIEKGWPVLYSLYFNLSSSSATYYDYCCVVAKLANPKCQLLQATMNAGDIIALVCMTCAFEVM